MATNNLTTNNLSSINYLKIFNTNVDLIGLPEDLSISTMTVTCNFDTLVNLPNIGKYMDLKFGGIVSIKYGDVDNTRSLIKLKKKSKKTKKNNKNFYNQATVIIDANNKRRVNTKIFKNGSIQMTGCKSLDHCLDALNILCRELHCIKAVYNQKEKKIIRKPFITDPENLDINKIQNFKIRMINSNFDIGFLIDRLELFKLLTKKNITCTYEPCIHACVNIKYNYKNKDTISVFVFESGSIIITGAKNKDHINEAYKFITNILVENYDDIVKNDIDEFLRRSDIKQLILDNNLIKLNESSSEVNNWA